MSHQAPKQILGQPWLPNKALSHKVVQAYIVISTKFTTQDYTFADFQAALLTKNK